MSDIELFVDAMNLFVPQDARLMMCSFRGDPETRHKGQWRARPYRAAILDPLDNLYFCVSAMKQNDNGEYRRRKENFVGGLCLMVDDIGYGKGAKFGFDKINGLPPTALIETSPGNFQAIYMFDKLERNMRRFELLINGFIDKQLRMADPGMAGVNRVFRPPYGVNGKEKYRDSAGRMFLVSLREADYSRRYPIDKLAGHFGVSLVENLRPYRPPEISEQNIEDRVDAFKLVMTVMRAAGMVKSKVPDQGGWIDVRCPWLADHTGGADNGTSMRLPHRDNQFYGSFRCHHGHCQGKGWRDLTQWISESDAEILNSISGWEF